MKDMRSVGIRDKFLRKLLRTSKCLREYGHTHSTYTKTRVSFIMRCTVLAYRSNENMDEIMTFVWMVRCKYRLIFLLRHNGCYNVQMPDIAHLYGAGLWGCVMTPPSYKDLACRDSKRMNVFKTMGIHILCTLHQL